MKEELSLQLNDEKAFMSEINTQKNVYLFTHGNKNLPEKVTQLLTEQGFSKDKIIVATPHEIGKVDDYMAMVWKPPAPSHIRLKKITGIEAVIPQGMIGLWRGVSSDDLFTIDLQ